MSTLDTRTLHAIAESAQSAVMRSEIGDRVGALAALERAERRLSELSATHPTHARVVRLARAAVARARAVVDTVGSETVTPRAARALGRAAARAIARAEG